MKSFKSIILAITTFIVTLPVVTASTGVGFLDYFISILSNFFTITVLDNTAVQVGFIRFLLFVASFSLIYMALSRTDFDRRPTIVLALVIAFGGALLTPQDWIFIYGGVLVGFLLVMFCMVCWKIALLDFNEGFLQHLLGLIILILVAVVLSYFRDWFNTGRAFGFAFPALVIGIDKVVKEWL